MLSITNCNNLRVSCRVDVACRWVVFCFSDWSVFFFQHALLRIQYFLHATFFLAHVRATSQIERASWINEHEISKPDYLVSVHLPPVACPSLSSGGSIFSSRLKSSSSFTFFSELCTHRCSSSLADAELVSSPRLSLTFRPLAPADGGYS